jgi:NTP pyrophosphatase (non-canonical NTP hydrolase)
MNNKPINTYQQLMAITAEECGELTQVCMKHIRKYSDKKEVNEKWDHKLIEEAGDVLCMIELMVEHGLFTDTDLRDRIEVKRNKLKLWSSLINE